MSDDLQKALAGVRAEIDGIDAESANCSLGWTGPFCHWDNRSLIGDKWTGPGVCVFVVKDFVERWAGPRHLFGELVALTLHELAHATKWLRLSIDAGWPMLFDLDAVPTREAAIADAREYALVPKVDDTKAFRAAIFDGHHPRDFGRSLIHLCDRAEKLLGWPMRVGRCNLPSYPGPYAFVEALADEPIRLAKSPLSEILAEPLPELYAALCRMHDERLEECFPRT